MVLDQGEIKIHSKWHTMYGSKKIQINLSRHSLN